MAAKLSPGPGVSLILNADDFGYTPEVNRGIAECVEAGAIRSVSMMANLPGFDDACERLREGLPVSLGAHLNFTLGRPVLPPREVQPLLSRRGSFLGPFPMAGRLLRRAAPLQCIEREARAQIERILSAQPARLWHLDVHHHLHAFPRLLELLIPLVTEYRIPAVRTPREQWMWKVEGGGPPWKSLALRLFARRAHARILAAGLKAPDALYAAVLTSSRDFARTLLSVIRSLGPGSSEIALHPGYSSPVLERMDSYHLQREGELRALLGERVREALRARDLRLISYRDLAESPPRVFSAEGRPR
ncbi:MAG: ChbG/HpnK family deacetylase [Candidatus Tectomicrobia bacterium]|nr:ChbG/HpnK family deacetylase [Candidatus Tectomicrobia bacterium]